MQKNIRVLIVTTNTKEIDKDNTTGVWLEEFIVPYLTFQNAKYEIIAASPKGGVSPLDEESLSCSSPNEWDVAKKILDNTLKLDDINYESFDAIYIPGGHGVMFDLAKDKKLGKILQYFYENAKLIGAICHGSAAFLTAKKSDGTPLVEGKKLAVFTNKEEHISKKDEIMPFSLEDKLKELGAIVYETKPYTENVVVDGFIVTGQNAQSSLKLADTMWKILG